MAAIWQNAAAIWLAQRGHLFPWAPVMLACGIGVYFALRIEPDAVIYGAAGAGIVLLILLGWRLGGIVSPVTWGMALILAGFCLAGLRAHQVAHPVLDWRYYGAIEGRVVGIDRSGSDALRLTLDRVVLERTAPRRMPKRVRVSLHGDQAGFTPVPGATVILTGHLSPPGGPVEPGGFDFQRHAWFLGLGGVGYTRTPVLILEPPESGQWVFRARMAMSERVQDSLPGKAGPFAAAIMTGDRSGLDQQVVENLRITNLAHLLAISGLHMGLVAGFVFAAVRLGLAAWPTVGLRVPSKKLAACVALVAAAGYLALSGGNVATERAFVMVAVALLAVLADRRALSLRGVAVAAMIVLILRPEALLGPGFQMSFAATTALVAVFNWSRGTPFGPGRGPAWLRPIMAVVISSGVAGLATAPIAAAHFNQFAHYGLLANLLTVPLMGVLVMPAAVLAACLLPLGLDWIALWVMGLGIDWILGVAGWVSALEGARGTVISPGPLILPMMMFGALFAVLWQGRLRLLGVAPVLVALLLWTRAERPDVLIADTGALVGVMTEAGRALSAPRGGGFVAENWLENDGDATGQDKAFLRWEAVQLEGWPLRAVKGKRVVAAVTECASGEWLILSAAPEVTLPCTVIHPGTLKQTGALALYRTETGLRAVSARQITGNRLWNSQ